MGDSSGGTQGPSGIQNMKEFLEKTKEKYNSLFPKDKRWPCPFCLNIKDVNPMQNSHYERPSECIEKRRTRNSTAI